MELVGGGLKSTLRLGVADAPEVDGCEEAVWGRLADFSFLALSLVFHHGSFFFGGSSIFLAFAGGDLSTLIVREGREPLLSSDFGRTSLWPG